MATLLSWIYFLTFLYATKNQMNEQGANTFRPIDYDLSAPDRIYKLPAALREISGITEINESTIACIQDEYGVVFIHDLTKNQIVRQFVFGGAGDYEGVTRVDNTLYILRSDELLTEIANFNKDNFKRTVYQTGIPGKDIEGLCYDSKNNRLLLMPKEISEDNKSKKHERYIYGFDLLSKKMIKGAVLKVDIQTVKQFAVENNIKVPMEGKKGKKQEPDIQMRISAISIHPQTGKLFALSGQERLLFVFDTHGNIEFLERLDKDLFTQAEGITFMKNGDMLISNEGKNEAGTLMLFNKKKSAEKR